MRKHRPFSFSAPVSSPPPRTNVPESPHRCGYDEQPQTPNQDTAVSPQSWIDLKQDAETGIETIRAHFEGHAYDPHWHDSYLIGYTEQGIQQFHCRREIQR